MSLNLSEDGYKFTLEDFNRFEDLFSLGSEARKQLSMSKKDAEKFRNIFDEALKEGSNPDLLCARTLCDQILLGNMIILYDAGKLNISAKKLTLGNRTIEFIDVKAQGADWVKRSTALLRQKFSIKKKVSPEALVLAQKKASDYLSRLKGVSDTTTQVFLKEAAAREYISVGKYKEAFALRTEISCLSFPPEHCLATMDKAIETGSAGKPLDRMGAYFQDIDTGSVKNGTIHASKKKIVEKASDNAEIPKEVFIFDFNLTHNARAELTRTLEAIQEYSDELKQISGYEFRVVPHTTTIIPAYVEKREVYARDIGYKAGRNIELEIIGLGKACIHMDANQHSLYNRVEIILDADKQQQQDDELKKLHTILALLGLGTTLCPSREEDTSRMKVFILLHAFFPQLSYKLERDPENYTISVEELCRKIYSFEPQAESLLKTYLEVHQELFVKEELYSGRQTYFIKDMGEQVRTYATGLIMGTKSTACSQMPWEDKPDEALKQFREIASQYAQKLKAGLAMESNKEAWLSRGEFAGGTSPSEDMKVGGFDSVFTRLVPNSYVGKKKLEKVAYCYDGIRILLHNDAMGYASTYAHVQDRYGARVDRDNRGNQITEKRLLYSERPSLPEFARIVEELGAQEMEGKPIPWDIGANEVMIRDLIPSRFVCSLLVKRGEMKEILVEEFRKAGLIQKQGEEEFVVFPGCVKSVDKFIYVGNVCEREMWAKPTMQ